MSSPVLFICCILSILSVTAFHPPSSLLKYHKLVPSHPLNNKHHDHHYYATRRDDAPMGIVRSPIRLDPSTTLLSPNMDTFSITAIFLGQSLLIITIMVLEIFTNFNLMPSAGYFSLNIDSLKVSIALSLPLIIGGWILDRISPTIYRNTKTFTLRLLGYATSPIVAFVTAGILSFCAGLSEEIFFRGFLFSFIEQYSNLPIAWIGSAMIFGLAHYPFFLGPQAIFEFFLGLYFTFVYWISGYNLVIPILVHAIYDFITLFGTWLFTSKTLQENIMKATERTKLMPVNEPELFRDTCQLVLHQLFKYIKYIILRLFDVGL